MKKNVEKKSQEETLAVLKVENLGVFKMKDFMIKFKTHDTVFDVITSLQARGVDYDVNNPEKFAREYALECNYSGIPLEEAKKLIEERYSPYTMLIIIENIYHEYSDKFAIKALMHNLKIKNNFDYGDDYFFSDWTKLPCIPPEIFQKLPEKLIERMVQYGYNDFNEQDIFISGASAVLERLFEWIDGIYYK